MALQYDVCTYKLRSVKSTVSITAILNSAEIQQQIYVHVACIACFISAIPVAKIRGTRKVCIIMIYVIQAAYNVNQIVKLS